MTTPAIETPLPHYADKHPAAKRRAPPRPSPCPGDLLELLHEASREIASILDREELLRRIAELVKPLIDYQLFGVFLWDEDAARLESVVSVHWDGCQSYKRDLDLGEGLVGTAAAERRPVRVGDVRGEPRYVNCGDHEVRSELALPLLVKGRLIGVLDLESYHQDAFRDDDERLLATLADNLAIALDNAVLYQRLKADEQALATDLETAREMQRVLLPRRTPWLPGLQTAVAYCPARHLGGDLYDFLSFGDNRTAIAVGDVAGKGTGAALYATLAVGHLRGYVSENACDPVCILGYLNDELRQLRDGNRFLALAFAVYDRVESTLTIGNSGVPYPYLLRGGEVEEIQVRGVPVGLMADVVYEPVTLDLQPGDTVVFTTDGIDEGLDTDDEPFGGERVVESLRRLAPGSASDIADGLLAASDRHLGGRDASDDRTVVVLKFTDCCCTSTAKRPATR
ncbi:MAG: GAF domain-containing SpoIIE family protein phosphatase [Thermoanaerobaculia bacterium]